MGRGQSLVYYFGLPEGWEPSILENKHALALWQRFVHDGTESDGVSSQPSRFAPSRSTHAPKTPGPP